MKIYSNFSDYYDTAMSYGVDDHVKWIRNPCEITHQHEFNTKHFQISYAYNLHIVCLWVGFCGKIYPVIKFQHDSAQNDVYCYNHDEVMEYVVNRDSKSQYKILPLFVSNKSRSYYNFDYLPFTSDAVKEFFSLNTESINELFLQYKTPVFVVHENGSFTFNIELKTLNFQKIFDPFSAYQEIEMYFGSVLCNTEITYSKIDDKYIAAGKGFDKWSFKNKPTKKR